MKNEIVDWNNYEEYLLMEVDGELDDASRQALEAFILANPDLEDERRLYMAAKNVPDMSVSYAGRDGLLKPEPKVISFSRRWLYAAAAAIVGLGFMVSIFNRDTDAYNSVAINAPLIKQPKPSATKQQSSSTPTYDSLSLNTLGHPRTRLAVSIHKPKRSKATLSAIREDHNLASLNGTGDKPLAAEVSENQLVVLWDRPLNSDNTVERINPKLEVPKTLHFAPQNTAAFQNLKALMAINLEKVQRARNTIKETALNVKMGGKNITINF